MTRPAVAPAILALLLLASSAAMAGDFPQARLDFLDLGQAPKVTLGFSFLDSQKRPVLPNFLETVDVLRHLGESDRRGSEARHFVNGKVREDEKALGGEMQPAAKAGRPLDAVLIVSGYGNPRFTDSDLGPGVLTAVDLFLKKFPKTGRLGLLWYNDQLFTQVREKGYGDELTVLNGQQKQALCRESRLKDLARTPEEKAAALKDNPDAAPGPVCGLFPVDPRLAKLVKERARFEGWFPALFGLPDPFPKGFLPEHENRARQGFHDEDSDRESGVLAAFPEALRTLLRSSAPDSPKAIVLLSDGVDGYTDALTPWRNRWKEQDCAAESGPAVAECVRRLEVAFLTGREKEFGQRLEAWVPLLRAANVRVFALALPSGSPHERRRLEVLADVSGGTYREATDPESLSAHTAALTDELGSQMVVSFADGSLRSGQEVGYSLRLKASGLRFEAPPQFGTVPEIPSGIKGLANKYLALLKDKVGSPWHLVILVVAGLVALLLVFLFLKLGVALIKKLFKGGADAAKKAGKAAGSAAKAPKLPKGPKPPAVPNPLGKWKK